MINEKINEKVILYMENFVKENKGPDFNEQQTYVHEGEAKKQHKQTKPKLTLVLSLSFPS